LGSEDVREELSCKQSQCVDIFSIVYWQRLQESGGSPLTIALMHLDQIARLSYLHLFFPSLGSLIGSMINSKITDATTADAKVIRRAAEYALMTEMH